MEAIMDQDSSHVTGTLTAGDAITADTRFILERKVFAAVPARFAHWVLGSRQGRAADRAAYEASHRPVAHKPPPVTDTANDDSCSQPQETTGTSTHEREPRPRKKYRFRNRLVA